MEYRILGSVCVSDGDRLIPVRAAKQRALLAILLLNANRWRPIGLIDQLWDSRPPGTARKVLQTYVSKLRRVTGDAMLITCPAGYELHMGRRAGSALLPGAGSAGEGGVTSGGGQTVAACLGGGVARAAACQSAGRGVCQAAAVERRHTAGFNPISQTSSPSVRAGKRGRTTVRGQEFRRGGLQFLSRTSRIGKFFRQGLRLLCPSGRFAFRSRQSTATTRGAGSNPAPFAT